MFPSLVLLAGAAAFAGPSPLPIPETTPTRVPQGRPVRERVYPRPILMKKLKRGEMLRKFPVHAK